MKKVYTKPIVEIERYALDASIAANCGPIVTLGPGGSLPGQEICPEFKGSWDVVTLSTDISFYETGTVCDCYYSSGGEGYFTS